MADPHDLTDDTGVGPGRGSTSGPPRWVKVFGVIALVVVLLLLVLLLTSGGSHGPARHESSRDAGGQTANPSATGSAPAGGQTPSA